MHGAIPAMILELSTYHPRETIRQTTAASVSYSRRCGMPLTASDIWLAADDKTASSLDWMLLTQTVMRNARPMTANERAATNAFFWSLFE